METSREVSELYSALSKAQAEFKSLPLNCINPHFKSKYANLTITQEYARGPLGKHGLSLIQSLESDENGYFVESILAHSSGQWLKSRIKLMLFKNDMQGLGSATTYAKRYAAQSILGLSGDDDDDGNAASQPPKSNPLPQPTKVEEKPKVKNSAPASQNQMEVIYSLAIDRDVKESELNYLIKEGYGVQGNVVPNWIALEIEKFLSDPDVNSGSVMAQAVKIANRREAARLQKEGKNG